MALRYFLLAALVAIAASYPLEEYEHDVPEELYEIDAPPAVYSEPLRFRRSLQPGAPNFPAPNQQNGGWSVNPNIARDDGGNTKTNVEVNHKGENHDFNAGWGKVIRGPGRAKPTWHVGGSIRW